MNKQGDTPASIEIVLRRAGKLRKDDNVLNLGELESFPTHHFGYGGTEMVLLTFKYTRIEVPANKFFFVEVETTNQMIQKMQNASPSPRMRAAARNGVSIE